jgi:hypothetical protein
MRFGSLTPAHPRRSPPTTTCTCIPVTASRSGACALGRTICSCSRSPGSSCSGGPEWMAPGSRSSSTAPLRACRHHRHLNFDHGDACVAARDGVYFFSADGIYRTTGGTPQKVSRAIDAVFNRSASMEYATVDQANTATLIDPRMGVRQQGAVQLQRLGGTNDAGARHRHGQLDVLGYPSRLVRCSA